eukprot:UN10838
MFFFSRLHSLTRVFFFQTSFQVFSKITNAVLKLLFSFPYLNIFQ